ncbi:unnamed protein product [Chrysoparadoxa australica]
MASLFRHWREKLAPGRDASLEDGLLSQEAFIAAGDELTGRVPTWSWESCDPSTTKQYLLQRGVLCQKRADELGEGDDAGWVLPNVSSSIIEEAELTLPQEHIRLPVALNEHHFDEVTFSTVATSIKTAAIEDLADFAEPNLVQPDPGTANEAHQEDEFVYRQYDVSICYSRYYQTPQLWLHGHCKGVPLTAQEMFEDIIPEYGGTSVTFDRHPFTSVRMLAVHPCQHKSVLKRMGATQNSHVLMLFLKIAQAIAPHIRVDCSYAFDVNT